MRRAVYAGSFDPVTFGHLDIARRAVALFDEVVLAVGENPAKRYLLDLGTRMRILEDATADVDAIRVEQFTGLLVDFCKKVDAMAIVRGLRAVTDFEFEFQIGLANRDMAPQVETVFLLADPENIFISSSLCKEIFANGGDISRYVPAAAVAALEAARGR